ncbi:hypothetical protein [Halobacteriovorax sp. YZS-1-1]|uniref:hypothetical protein n=1 Tax=unclassified Halobacteriovorax TaxID=2639665 RepID=UPI00399B2A9F
MDIKLITQLVPLFFLGAMTFFGIIFFYFINSINIYYKKYAKLIKGKIIAFKEESKTYRSNRRTTRTTTICPVIEYYQDGQRKLFLGTNQSFLKNRIGKSVDVYIIEGKEDYVLQKENVYKIFSLASLAFILAPILIISTMDVDLIYKVVIPFFGILLLLPPAIGIRKKMIKNLKESGDNRSLIQVIQESFLKNKSIIDIKDFETSDEYIKSAARFNKKVSNTHFYGIVLTTIFGCGLYYLIKHVYHTKLHSRDKVLFTNFLNDFNNYHPIIDELGKNDDVTVFCILIAFSIIITYGFIINLSGWIKSR